MKVNQRIPIHGLAAAELATECEAIGLPAFRARQVWNWLYVKNVSDWKTMRNLPTEARTALSGRFDIEPGRVVHIDGASGKTRKLLVRLDDDQHVETVVIPAGKRLTVCLSSQVGCRWHCAFCASGQGGYQRNLGPGEIIGQVLLAWREAEKKPSHVVFMGVGEPMDNYSSVLRAIRILNNPDGLNMAARRLTLSTSGIIPGIRKLAEEGLQVELSVSLHAPNDEIRTALMPVNRKYPMKPLLETCRDYALRTKRIVTFEYTLIKDMNDSPKCARELAGKLVDLPSRVNLIPLSPVEEFEGAPPSRKAATVFMTILKKKGINVTLRASRGGNINAACGQLRAGVRGQGSGVRKQGSTTPP